MMEQFSKIYWFIVGITSFGAFFSVYVLIRFKGEVAERFADQLLIFWLTTAVGGGIGYLIGSSMGKANVKAPPGSTVDTVVETTEKKTETTTTETAKDV
jgi:hypothetical protein